ncbi:MAG: hypothetical protein CTY18_06040 [Methylomonas sp.]|nr:MAG: hypothetical protein CTY24_11810 [Methylobacter sp.]PPD36034.1 MAG: hypothetical protein CTY18_06040 [Methylomonas sp.]
MMGLENPEPRMTEDEVGQHAGQFFNDLALMQHKQSQAPEHESLEWCVQCGSEIPEPRRKALLGVELCIDCARENEIKQKRFA